MAAAPAMAASGTKAALAKENVGLAMALSLFSVFVQSPERKEQVTSFAPWLKTIANSML